MKKYIVTTTIFKPSAAMEKFAAMEDWTLVVVGDTKTPHEDYQNRNDLIYLHPDEQEKICKELSDILGWATIQRRNIGLFYAYNCGAEVIATVDDDNIPYDNWGKNLLLNKEIEVDYYSSNLNVFDPLFVTNANHLWHRGFPIDYVRQRHAIYLGKKKIKPLVQADLWDGDPDIDAMARLRYKPLVKFDRNGPFASDKAMPFNSQNTFLHRDVIPYYMVLPFVGRMDDIWGAYILQKHFPKDIIVFNDASVYQDRNVQDLTVNLEKEIIGYRKTLDLINTGLENLDSILPEKTMQAYNIYRNLFKK